MLGHRQSVLTPSRGSLCSGVDCTKRSHYRRILGIIYARRANVSSRLVRTSAAGNPTAIVDRVVPTVPHCARSIVCLGCFVSAEEWKLSWTCTRGGRAAHPKEWEGGHTPLPCKLEIDGRAPAILHRESIN